VTRVTSAVVHGDTSETGLGGTVKDVVVEVLLSVHGVNTSHQSFSGVLFNGAWDTTNGEDVSLHSGELKGLSTR